jgi:hypothetical protein
VAAGAAALHKIAMIIQNDSDKPQGISAATWVLASSQQKFWDQKEIDDADEVFDESIKPQLWTDDYSSLFKILK